MVNKVFAERLNRELDNIGVPEMTTERVQVLAKLLKLPKFTAESLLSGIIPSNPAILQALAEELEVNPDWLLGKSDSKSA